VGEREHTTAEMVERVQSALWDCYYGKGPLSTAYVQSADKDMKAVLERIAKLEAALEWYATAFGVAINGRSIAQMDNGDRAREALSQSRPTPAEGDKQP
jgi:hypothetical protein